MGMVEFVSLQPPSSRGPGRGPLKAKTGVRIPLGALDSRQLPSPLRRMSRRTKRSQAAVTIHAGPQQGE
jgi:hypothetical protein